MLQGQVTTVKEIVLDGFIFREDFGELKVFTKPNTILYWNSKNSTVQSVYTYIGKVNF